LFDTGDIEIAGTLTSSHTFTDYAEYFENLESGVLPLGSLVSLNGRKVGLAQSGDTVLGVVSATAVVAAGDTPFTWQGRFMIGEFGEMLYHDIPDPDYKEFIPDPDWVVTLGSSEDDRPSIANPVDIELVSVQRENPQYDPNVKNVPRSDRPDDWSCIGLLGQIHVRVGEDVTVGDFVKSGENGVGVKSSADTNVRCMEIRQEFDGEKRYAVAFCLVK
jgi:hypothetical protein